MYQCNLYAIFPWGKHKTIGLDKIECVLPLPVPLECMAPSDVMLEHIHHRLRRCKLINALVYLTCHLLTVLLTGGSSISAYLFNGFIFVFDLHPVTPYCVRLLFIVTISNPKVNISHAHSPPNPRRSIQFSKGHSALSSRGIFRCTVGVGCNCVPVPRSRPRADKKET